LPCKRFRAAFHGKIAVDGKIDFRDDKLERRLEANGAPSRVRLALKRRMITRATNRLGAKESAQIAKLRDRGAPGSFSED
jgi:hypothetical protein